MSTGVRPYAWPSESRARDHFVLHHRSTRPAHDPWQPQGLLVEDERAADGTVARVATLFLTGRECPWRCVMCDLWTHTTTSDTPEGAIPAQLAAARVPIDQALPSVSQIKLYNAGSFFDPRAVPEGDYDDIAALVSGFDRVIVESHPALIGPRLDRFVDALRRAAGPSGPDRAARVVDLEVAIGLETAHPDALERLHKRMDLDGFARATDRLRANGVALRVFLLVAPPFIPAGDQDRWLLRSVEMAISCHATAVSLIPTRSGNGALDALAAGGLFRAPRLRDLERSLDAAVTHAAGRTRIFADLWELDRLAECPDCIGVRRARLHAVNLEQRVQPPAACDRCRRPRTG